MGDDNRRAKLMEIVAELGDDALSKMVRAWDGSPPFLMCPMVKSGSKMKAADDAVDAYLLRCGPRDQIISAHQYAVIVAAFQAAGVRFSPMSQKRVNKRRRKRG